MSWQATMEAVAAGAGSSIGVAAVARRWFRAAVRDVVKDEMADVVKRQADVVTHLNEQDRRLERIEEILTRRRR